MPRATFIPFGPPNASPTTINTRVSAVRRKAVRNTFMVVSPGHSRSDFSLRDPYRLDSGCSGRLFLNLFGRRAFETHSVLVSVAIHADVITRQHFAFEDLHGQRILN